MTHEEMLKVNALYAAWAAVADARREAQERTGLYLDHKFRRGLYQVVSLRFDGRGGLASERPASGWGTLHQLPTLYESVQRREIHEEP